MIIILNFHFIWLHLIMAKKQFCFLLFSLFLLLFIDSIVLFDTIHKFYYIIFQLFFNFIYLRVCLNTAYFAEN